MSNTPKYTIVIDIFENMEETPAPQPTTPIAPAQLDPIKELKTSSGPITIHYDARFQNSSTKAFMDFSKSDARWLTLLITDLKTLYLRNMADNKLMHTTARARNRYNDAQTWQDIIEGLYDDKIKGGRDFSEGQMKNLSKLIDLLGTGIALAKCQSVVFVERTTGKELA